MERLRLTSSLAGALRRLRFTDALRTLWVDAVCINQADNSKKNSEVTLGAKVSRMATCVVTR